uniref:Uncharacterized protein n=1 Tax=Oryza brachyantha TaxID=4533 RepID=J3MQS6_ORYBR
MEVEALLTTTRKFSYSLKIWIAGDEAHGGGVVGALGEDLAVEELPGSSPPSSSSREYHSFAQTETAADGDGDGERMELPGRKAGLLGCGDVPEKEIRLFWDGDYMNHDDSSWFDLRVDVFSYLIGVEDDVPVDIKMPVATSWFSKMKELIGRMSQSNNPGLNF